MFSFTESCIFFQLASILIDAVKDHEEGDADIGKLRIVLGPHLSLLESISGKFPSSVLVKGFFIYGSFII